MSENSDQQQQQQSQDQSSQTDGQQQQQAAFYESFADADLKTNPTVQRYKSAEDLARGYVNLEKRFGVPAERIMTLPEKLDDPGSMKEIWKKLGGPETVEGYKLDLTGASDEDKAAIGKFTAAMHAAGPYPPGVVAEAVNWFRGEVKAQGEAQAAELARIDAEGKATLQKEWGAAYKTTSEEVGKLLKDLGGDDLAKELNETTFGSNPRLAIFLGKVAEKMREPGPNGDGQTADVGNSQMTPAQATARSRELEAHPAFMDAAHPQHKDVVKQRNDALRMAQAKPAES